MTRFGWMIWDTRVYDLIIAATAKASDRHIVSADPTAFRNLPGVETFRW